MVQPIPLYYQYTLAILNIDNIILILHLVGPLINKTPLVYGFKWIYVSSTRKICIPYFIRVPKFNLNKGYTSVSLICS